MSNFECRKQFETFLWAYKFVATRAFAQGEGMLVPLADCVNHDDVAVDYRTLSQHFLESRSNSTLITDYSSFSSSSPAQPGLMKTRTHKNRLEKYLAWFNTEKISEIGAIWEIDQILTDLESSTDEEEPIHVWTSEESSEESGEDFDLHFDPNGQFFVMRTKEKGSFKENEQVFNCYGRLNNFDLLLEYGFAIWPNRYDSLYVRMKKGRIATTETKKKGFKTFNLKADKLNLQILGQLRERYADKTQYFNSVAASKEEIKIVREFSVLMHKMYAAFPTSIEEDKAMLSQTKSHRKVFALSNSNIEYRISHKEILLSQLKLANTLLAVLNRVETGADAISAHWAEKSPENSVAMYPLRTYLKGFYMYYSRTANS
jgi:hypothetical protein